MGVEPPSAPSNCTGSSARRGHRVGQLRYYLRASAREYRQYGLRRALRRFWVARWFWSCGRIGVVPMGHSSDYWRIDSNDPPESLPERLRWVTILWARAVATGMIAGVGIMLILLLIVVVVG